MTLKLSARNLSMRFKDRVLFYIPEIKIGPNEAVYLKGDNGVGKTTLLKIFAGLVEPTDGEIDFPSPSWFKRALGIRTRRDIIYLHQSPYLFDGTVYQNVAYGVKYGGECKLEKRNRVITALRMVGLETLAEEHVSLLSGGEKQRVAMARAWILNPSILLMDEPSASLDQESIDRLVVMSKDLLSRGASLVITSHQSNALTQLCQKQWCIENKSLSEKPLLQLIQEKHYAISNAN
ncbi:putative ABC-type tungstate transport system,ATP-binding protein [Vibrio nigripulchritudo SFn27]|uniref:Putative ABC-type tungstate transport system, ATP-binding protein n=1 Tax=Vibrio nigripulchritudo TaxID=28173 RepID=U4KBQ3_9VIBR|nr:MULTISPECIES: energy-coupling factor ABC transporter ATP-binding protein [Vibrio]KJY76896.1 ABC transporter ATP-binding protein [Vibrio nigripulchritudo]UAB68735.1 energy-coupling factor ABC transporter ATP-binding protein [Vibrio sp. SCSIO 43132]CCN84210.1 putative ABC-type tungstate transport system,ATP-binding protein [Vibrio nigripulchritudo BLFn1]CCN87125.1 putative ABC-type tungstate transport system,ATP-binding protein [Vibrio nigripulchritudo SFn27]CCN93170.1 putative ABC-type tungs